MGYHNKMKISFSSISENESFARSVAGLFALQLNPNLSEITDVKTAVSEAVTNSIVHGYPKGVEGQIELEGEIIDDVLHINVFDYGVGIQDVNEALEPFFTTKESEERSGMGFTIMRTFMDDVIVKSVVGEGTRVYMTKKIKSNA